MSHWKIKEDRGAIWWWLIAGVILTVGSIWILTGEPPK
jgi:hypothetical protein